MKFNVSTLTRAKRVAKLLRQRLDTAGVQASLPSCQNLVAVMYGFAHWHELAANPGLEPASPDDETAGPEITAARRDQQMAALANKFPKIRDFAGAIIDAVKPTSSGRIGEPSASSNVLIHPIDRPDISGVVIAHRSSKGRVADSYVVAGIAGSGALKIRKLKGVFAATPEAAAKVFDSGKLRGGWIEEDLPLGMLGYWRTNMWSRIGHGVAARASEFDKANARRLVERHLDAEAFGLVVKAEGPFKSKAYDYYRDGGSGGDLRRAFARQFPSLALYPFDWPLTSKVVEECTSPIETAARYLQQAAKLGPREASLAAARFSGAFGWSYGDHSHMPAMAALLGRIPQTMVPSSLDERIAFSWVAGILDEVIGDRVLDRHDVIMKIAMSIDAPTWNGIKQHICESTRRAITRLTASGVSLAEDDDCDDVAEMEDVFISRFYRGMGQLMSQFSSSALEPVMAKRGYRNGKNAGYVGRYGDLPVPREVFESSCAKLFLDGLTFATLIEKCERWRGDEDVLGSLLKSDSDEASLLARIGKWRPYFQSDYREIGIDGVVAMVETDFSARANMLEGYITF